MSEPSLVSEPLTQGIKPMNCDLPLYAPLSTSRQVQHQRIKLLASLRGQQICIPNLGPLLQHWPTKTNQHLQSMREDIHQWLSETVSPGKVLQGLQASDFGLFGATWWPFAAMDKLKITTYLAVWLFTWDDEIDLSDGTMWDEFGAAQTYRKQTIAYVRYTLGIDSRRPDVSNRIILNFEPIGIAVREHYSLEKRMMFVREMEFFMETSEKEQRLRLSGTVPSLDEFWHYRLGSSAVAVCLALNEFSWEGMNLPIEFYADKDVRALFRYTNTIISAVNDLLSIKKEIKRDAIDSLIPIIYFRVGDIQSAVYQVVEFVRGEISSMDEAAESLISKYHDEDPTLQDQVRKFIDGCKCYVTGNLTWSLETDRYGVDRMDDATGMIRMSL